MSKTILIITLSLIMLGGQVLAADVGKAAPAQAPSQKGQGQLPSKEVPPFKPIPICGEAQQACGEKIIVKEYVLVDPEKSFDRSLDILNLATAIMGIFMTAFTIFVAIVGALGFLEIRKWRKTRQAIDEDARAINKLKEGLEKDVDSLRGEIAGEIPPSLEVKPPKEVQEKLDELSRKMEFAEMLGAKLNAVDFYNRGVDLYYKNNF
ncbi:MAG: hypothetical protein ACE5EI_08220, partial [Thermodesulfobacteriota bacterium]